MYQKLKSWLASDLIFMLILLVLVAVTAFLLGRYSVPHTTGVTASLPTAAPVRLMMSPETPQEAAPAALTGGVDVADTAFRGDYVASKTGSKYHHRSCPGAKQIKPENQVWFVTATEATAAGYTKAANCDR